MGAYVRKEILMNIDIHNYPTSTDPKVLTAYKIAVMQAYLDGEKIEAHGGSFGWYVTDPTWSWGISVYRVKKPTPQPVLVPWTKETFPTRFLNGGAIFRNVGRADQIKKGWSYNYVEDEGLVASPAPTRGSFASLFACSEYSTDEGVTWSPCGTMEVPK